MTFLKKLKKLYFFIADTILNFLQRPEVIYVVDDFNWSIRHDGESLCKSISHNIKIRTTTSHLCPQGTIIHFGDIYTFFSKRGLKKVNSKSPIILTWFHIVENDIGFKYYHEYRDRISYLHLSNRLSVEKLLAKNFPQEKIFFAPIPVNTSVFKRKKTKEEAKRSLGIPENKIVIGSFQKDGNGWGEGLEPKLVKGPDIFCEIVEKLSDELDTHILLSGPARGYVIQRLKRKNIAFSHYFFDDSSEVVNLYEALDLYLMTSRVEGGPKSVTESWAMEVPYAGTRVGMVNDIGIDGKNFIEIDINDIESSAQKVLQFIRSPQDIKEQLTANALNDVQALSLKEISQMYIDLYQGMRS